MSGHTPGPWEACGLLIRSEFKDDGGWLIADCSHTQVDAQANARLIAASPDFYTFAQEIALGAYTLDEAADRARALLAKATGAA